jgi:two-component system sensor histidine kinase VicK
MRWWLAIAFALIVAVTATVVAEVLRHRSATAFRGHAEAVTVGRAVAAASAISSSRSLDAGVTTAAHEQGLSLFVFDRKGRLLSERMSGGLSLGSVPNSAQAIAEVRDGGRYVDSVKNGDQTVVGLRLPRLDDAVLVAYNPHTDVSAEIGIVGKSILEAAVSALVVGALAGLLVSFFITQRIRRVASSAAQIERGDFSTPLAAGFPDEVGELARSVDQMRSHLAGLFSELAGERDRLRQLIERLHDGVVMVDARGIIQVINSTAAKWLCVPADSRGTTLPTPWPEFDLREAVATMFQAPSHTLEARVTDDDHTFSIAVIPPGDGSATAVVVLTDVTQQERRERAEREFVSTAAHELRTPIAAISGAAELLLDGAAAKPEARDRFLSNIKHESDRLARLTDSLMTLARAQTGAELIAVHPLAIAEIARDVVDRLAGSSSIRLQAHRDLSIVGHHDLVHQAVSNVVGNALKHGQPPITVDIKRDVPGWVTVSVSDAGQGLPEGDNDRLLERFYTGRDRDSNGFGLGLAIVREVIRELGGHIELVSQKDSGTTVRLLFQEAFDAN